MSFKISECNLIARSGHRIIVDEQYLYCWGGFNPNYWEHENTDDTRYPLFREVKYACVILKDFNRWGEYLYTVIVSQADVV